MSEEKQPAFQMNSQVLIALAVVLLALALPITCMLLSIMPRPVAKVAPPSDAHALDGLRASLEKSAENGLPEASLGNGKLAMSLPATDIAQEKARVELLAQSFGASVFATQSGDQQITLLAQVPAAKLQAFLEACQKGDYSAELPPAGEASALVEIVINRRP